MCNRLASLALLFTASVVLPAANVINTTGSNSFGFTDQPGCGTAWTQTIGYSGVTITMPLEDNSSDGPIGGVEGTVYLMNQIGPGTTSANQVAAPVSVSGLTNAFASKTLFSGLTLPPGSYYVVLIPTNASPMSMSPDGTNVGTLVTTGTSVTSLGVGVPSTIAGDPPASAVTLSPPGNLYLSVTGTPAAPPSTPAPPSLLLTLAGLACVGCWFARRKFVAVK